MIKRISDIKPIDWHEDDVNDAIDELQKEGFEVTQVVKVERYRVWGRNITEIIFKNN